jgi:hypothetical protein
MSNSGPNEIVLECARETDRLSVREDTDFQGTWIDCWVTA